MSERLPLSDNPSLETQVALIVQALGNFMEVTRGSLERIERKVDITNGSVAGVTQRMNLHDLHHGPSDMHIAELLEAYRTALTVAEDKITEHAAQLSELVGEDHDAKVRRQLVGAALALFLGGAAAVPVVYSAVLIIRSLLGS
jgi:hypothetical protein